MLSASRGKSRWRFVGYRSSRFADEQAGVGRRRAVRTKHTQGRPHRRSSCLAAHAYQVLHGAETARQTSTASTDGWLAEPLSTSPVCSIAITGALPPLTRAVRHRYRGIEFNLVARFMTRDAIIQLDSGAIDLAFVGLPVRSTSLVIRLILRQASAPFWSAGTYLCKPESASHTEGRWFDFSRQHSLKGVAPC